MFTNAELRGLTEISSKELWPSLLPHLFQMLSCPANIQAQATKLFNANFELLVGLRHSSKRIMISPSLSYGRGVIDYVVDNTIVELKTSEGIAASHVCQVALYTFAAKDTGIYDPVTRKHCILPEATPALHFARFGAITKIPMPTINKVEVYSGIVFRPISSLVRDHEWLSRIFDMGEVQTLCADLEAYLTSRGMQVPVAALTPSEMGILGTLVDTITKVVLADNSSRTGLLVYTELTRVDIQLRRLHNVRAVND